jgi:hypothetical protein
MRLTTEIRETARLEVKPYSGAIMQTQIDQGASVRLKMIFKSEAGVLVDPTTIAVQISRDADGAFTEYDGTPQGEGITKESTGLYYIDLDTNACGGVWKYNIAATGAAPAAKQGQFYVIPTELDDELSSSSS